MRTRIIFLLTLVFLVSGCIGQAPAQDELSTGQFLGGEQGLELSYAQLPPKVFQGDPFDINIVADNRGEYTIPNGTAQFELSNSKAFGFDTSESVKSNDYGEISKTIERGGYGGQTIVTFSDAKYSGEVLTSESPVPISVEACYPYKTLAASDICIAQGEFSQICSPIEVKSVENSGAPVHVSEVEQLLSLFTQQHIRIGLLITIESKSESTDRYFSASSCNTRDGDNENEVVISKIRIGNIVFEPGNQNHNLMSSCGVDEGNQVKVRLVDGVGKIQCNFPITNYVPGAGDYVERMIVELDYVHTTLANTNVGVIPITVN